MNQIEFDKKCKCGNDFVCVRIIDNCNVLKIGDIWLTDTAGENGRLAHVIVEDIGKNAADKLGISIGDYAMIDRLSTFAHTAPVALLKYDSVIMKTNKDKSDFYPLKNTVFVQPCEKDPVSNVGGIYVPNYEDRLNVGTIEKMQLDDPGPFAVGDKVLLVKGGDEVKLGDKTIYIYKPDMLICTIED